MSEMDEKRLLDEALKEADAYFSENDLLENINAFLESEEVLAIILEGQNGLISNMKQIEAKAPENVQSVAEEMRKTFEKNVDAFRQDAIASFKMGLYSFVKELLKMNPDAELKKKMIEMIKKNLHETYIKDMKEICAEMMQRNTITFIKIIYSNYVPEGMPPKLASFVRLISGVVPMIPFTAFMVDSESEEDEQNPAES